MVLMIIILVKTWTASYECILKQIVYRSVNCFVLHHNCLNVYVLECQDKTVRNVLIEVNWIQLIQLIELSVSLCQCMHFYFSATNSTVNENYNQISLTRIKMWHFVPYACDTITFFVLFNKCFFDNKRNVQILLQFAFDSFPNEWIMSSMGIFNDNTFVFFFSVFMMTFFLWLHFIINNNVFNMILCFFFSFNILEFIFPTKSSVRILRIWSLQLELFCRQHSKRKQIQIKQ